MVTICTPSRAEALWAVVLTLLAVQAALGALTIAARSPTFDGTIHLTAGCVFPRTGGYWLTMLFPPPAAEIRVTPPRVLIKPGIPRGLMHEYFPKARRGDPSNAPLLL